MLKVGSKAASNSCNRTKGGMENDDMRRTQKMLNREKRKYRFAEKAKKNGEIVTCSWLRLCKSVENEGLGRRGV